MDRRVFVRVFSKAPISLDIETVFSKFGRIETAYLVNSSKTYEDGKHTMIGYVLYFDKKVALNLIQMRTYTHGNFQFVMKKVKSKDLTVKNSKKKSQKTQNYGTKEPHKTKFKGHKTKKYQA
jgi:hypothetical protein